jgi:hypothetical protein
MVLRRLCNEMALYYAYKWAGALALLSIILFFVFFSFDGHGQILTPIEKSTEINQVISSLTGTKFSGPVTDLSKSNAYYSSNLNSSIPSINVLLAMMNLSMSGRFPNSNPAFAIFNTPNWEFSSNYNYATDASSDMTHNIQVFSLGP